MSIKSMMPSNHLILSHPFLLLPSIFPSIRVFSSESVLCIRWPEYWSFSFNPSNKYSGLISFRIDWFDLLAVQGLSRIFSSTTIGKHQFFSTQPSLMVHLSCPFMRHTLDHSFDYTGHCQTTRKTIALTIWTFVSNVMSLLFNTLPKLVIAFLSRSKHLLISWLQSPSAVIFPSSRLK